MIDTTDLALIFGVRLADDLAVAKLRELSPASAMDQLALCVRGLQDVDARFLVEVESRDVGHAVLRFRRPVAGSALALISGGELPEIDPGVLGSVHSCLVFSLQEGMNSEQVAAEYGFRRENVLVLDPPWAAALLVERLPPDYLGVGLEGIVAGPSGYASVDAIPDGSNRPSRSQSPHSVRLDYNNAGDYVRRARTAVEDTPPYDGSILLATTFLPPVVHSVQAVKRYHGGQSTAVLSDVEARYKAEWRLWEQHVSQHLRIDVLDRTELEAYFRAPEYHQMALHLDEVEEQVERLVRLLAHENYTMCLCPEAIDIPFEIRGHREIRIRTDRRNKGRPRPSRITALNLESDAIAEVFEREFWALVEVTEPEFKNKEAIANWLRAQVQAAREDGLATMR